MRQTRSSGHYFNYTCSCLVYDSFNIFFRSSPGQELNQTTWVDVTIQGVTTSLLTTESSTTDQPSLSQTVSSLKAGKFIHTQSSIDTEHHTPTEMPFMFSTSMSPSRLLQASTSSDSPNKLHVTSPTRDFKIDDVETTMSDFNIVDFASSSVTGSETEERGDVVREELTKDAGLEESEGHIQYTDNPAAEMISSSAITKTFLSADPTKTPEIPVHQSVTGIHVSRATVTQIILTEEVQSTAFPNYDDNDAEVGVMAGPPSSTKTTIPADVSDEVTSSGLDPIVPTTTAVPTTTSVACDTMPGKTTGKTTPALKEVTDTIATVDNHSLAFKLPDAVDASTEKSTDPTDPTDTQRREEKTTPAVEVEESGSGTSKFPETAMERDNIEHVPTVSPGEGTKNCTSRQPIQVIIINVDQQNPDDLGI